MDRVWVALGVGLLLGGVPMWLVMFIMAGRAVAAAWQGGWDEGFDRGFPHGIRADGGEWPEDDWCPGCGFANNSAGPCGVCGYDRETGQHDEDFLREQETDRPWDDTAENLELLAQRYLPAPIFDELATVYSRGEWISAPVVPSAGAETEPPAPEIPRDLSAATSGQRSTDPSPGVDSSGYSGAGADPWQEITTALDEDPELNEWSIRADRARCHEISRELRELGKALSGPFELTPWKGATA